MAVASLVVGRQHLERELGGTRPTTVCNTPATQTSAGTQRKLLGCAWREGAILYAAAAEKSALGRRWLRVLDRD